MNQSKTVFSKENNSRLFLLCFAVWIHAASSLLAATTLPSAVREFGGGDLIGWAFTLYLLGSILAGSSSALLLNFSGLRSALSAGALIYLVGCLICASSVTMYVVLVGRLLQGVGGGYLVALAFIAIRHWFDPGLMPKVMALISAVWSMSAFAGPLVGGTFSTFGNWRLAFLVVGAQAIIFIILVRKITPKTKISDTKDNKKIPLFRLFLISTSVLMIAFAGINVHLIISPLLCILSLIFFLITLRIDRHEGSLNKTRIFPSNPFSLSTRKGAGLLLILMTSIASQSYMVYGPLLLETIHLITPLIAGYMIAFEAVCWGLAAVVVASIKVPNEGLNIKIGIFSLLIALVGLAFFIENGPIWVILIFGGLQGACFGIMWAFLVKRINESALKNEENITASSIPTIQQVGFAFGAALTGVVANAFGLGAEVSVSSAKAASFWMFICFIPFALISCIAGMRLAR